MWKKVIFDVVLVAFVGVQLANSLSCYSCKDPASCQNPTLQTCSNVTANETSVWLSTLHNNVPSVEGSLAFFCTNLTYYHASNNSRIIEYLGCVHPNTMACGLNLTNVENREIWSKDCRNCNTDYCNKKNPAGTFSGSAYTMIGSVLALLLAKILS
ncbi:uncharacterized protein LOC117588224 [Drosophila guanche]|uniref:Protein quiver n=1 Tax=Drosophila guanche TaxID=7266 RepID=A0A3B0JUS8_DROGU|nr:uncharacterized protein LOC117588224 [Drosophila guanche]SPP85844.1 Hypothetical predicted protein [Drosophila guanche]